MVEYNIVRYCRHCKKRFVVSKGTKKYLCDECGKRQEELMNEQIS
jgi:predicted RNA-binding Zn-ribbon protein involved in translation (DUF1610 family)